MGKKSLRLLSHTSLREVIKGQRYLVKGLLPRWGVGMIWGPPGSLKTFWVIDLALHVVLGWTYQGRKVDQGPVVYCPFEGTWGIVNRLSAFCVGHDLPTAPKDFLILADDLRFRNAIGDGHKLLIQSIKDTGIIPRMVVLDTLNQSLVGSENNDEDVGFYLSAAKDISREFDCITLIVHHTGKTGGDLRGHSSMRGNADVLLATSRSGEKGTSTDMVSVMVEKMKDGPEGTTVHNWVRIAELGEDEDGEEVTSCYLLPAPPPAGIPLGLRGRSQAAKALAILESLMVDDGTCSLDKWKAACLEQKLAKGTHVAQLKAFRRACDELAEKNMIHFDGMQVILGGI